jgi:hypothetical protein
MLCAFEDAQFGVKGAIQFIQSSCNRHCPNGVFAGWTDDCEIYEIGSAAVAMRKVAIEEAPVRAGLVKSARDWPFSSAHRHAPQGSYLGHAVA